MLEGVPLFHLKLINLHMDVSHFCMFMVKTKTEYQKMWGLQYQSGGHCFHIPIHPESYALLYFCISSRYMYSHAHSSPEYLSFCCCFVLPQMLELLDFKLYLRKSELKLVENIHFLRIRLCFDLGRPLLPELKNPSGDYGMHQ